MEKKIFSLLLLFALVGAGNGLLETRAAAKSEDEKVNDGKKLFLEVSIAISEGRFADGHAMAEKLIRDHAGDYQIDLYLSRYLHSFYFLDEDFRKGQLHPTPSQMQTKIDQMKEERSKSVMDLVRLGMVGDGPGGGFCVEYLREILQRFPRSIWADWAATEVRFSDIFRDAKTEEERYREFYNFGKSFMQEHQHSYVTPRLLCITATARERMSQDEAGRDEAISMCRRVLKDYAVADYYCAYARQKLRGLLGDNYVEAEGCSEDRDRIITRFYCHSPEATKYKKYTAEYVQVIGPSIEKKPERVEGKAKKLGKAEKETVRPSLLGGTAAYVAIAAAIVVGIVALILLSKKKASTRSQ